MTPDAVSRPGGTRGAFGQPRVVAVILTYNCAPLVRKAYEKIPKDCVDEIIATDDGSKDGSHEAAQALGIPAYRHTPNRGYGGNLKAGIRRALKRGADYIVEVHGDGQFDPGAIREALPHMRRGVGFILGSRFQIPRRALENGMPLARFVANRGLSAIDRLVLRLPFTEFHTGFRVYSRQFLAAVSWERNADNYLFSFQIIAQAAYAGVPVAEVPVEADYRGEHTSHSIRGASWYAVQTFGVLAHFLLARAGVWHSALFPLRQRPPPAPDPQAADVPITASICRGCGADTLRDLFYLGQVPSVNTFFAPPEAHRERPVPLTVSWCETCTLVQLKTIIPPAALFRNYQHLSSASQSNAAHLADVARHLTARLAIDPETRVLDVGSNDGTLLAQFRPVTTRLLGVDPAENLVERAHAQGVEQLAAFLNAQTAERLVREHGQFDVILALNVVAHTPGAVELLRAVARVLAPGGTFVLEAVHVLKTILRGEFDTVYHEHVYCFSLTALTPLLARAGLTVVDVEEIPTQGGSLRVYARHAGEHSTPSAAVVNLLAGEERAGVRDPETYRSIGTHVEEFKRAFVHRLRLLRERHGRVYGLGAPARGVVILNACGIGPELLDAVIDDTPLKQGRLVPGRRIPVISWNDLPDPPPSGFVLLSWNYEREMLEKLRRVVPLAEILVPFPEMREVTFTPAVQEAHVA